MGQYRYVKAAIPGFKSDAMDMLSTVIARELGLERLPELVYMRDAASGDAGPILYQDDERKVRGCALVREGKVLVNARLSAKQMIETVAHEFRHAWQHQHARGFAEWGGGRPKSGADYRASEYERDAIAYGEWWARRVPIPEEGVALMCGFGHPEDRGNKQYAAEIPGCDRLYYLNLKNGLLYALWSLDWRHGGAADLAVRDDVSVYPFDPRRAR